MRAKTASALVRSSDLIAYEDLQIANLVKNHQLAKSISDAAWGQFLGWLRSYGAIANVPVVAVSPRFTTQECSGCGERVKKSLSMRTHVCPESGLVLDRDDNAALNILSAALEYLAALRTAGQAGTGSASPGQNASGQKTTSNVGSCVPSSRLDEGRIPLRIALGSVNGWTDEPIGERWIVPARCCILVADHQGRRVKLKRAVDVLSYRRDYPLADVEAKADYHQPSQGMRATQGSCADFGVVLCLYDQRQAHPAIRLHDGPVIILTGERFQYISTCAGQLASSMKEAMPDRRVQTVIVRPAEK